MRQCRGNLVISMQSWPIKYQVLLVWDKRSKNAVDSETRPRPSKSRLETLTSLIKIASPLGLRLRQDLESWILNYWVHHLNFFYTFVWQFWYPAAGIHARRWCRVVWSDLQSLNWLVCWYETHCQMMLWSSYCYMSYFDIIFLFIFHFLFCCLLLMTC